MTAKNAEPIAYHEAIAGFSREALAATLAGDLTEGLDACVECCDRHAAPGRVALRWRSHDGRHGELTFAELKERSARFASFITAAGLKPGDVVAGLIPRVPDLLTVILGAWRAGALYQPLFTAFGPKAIEHRLAMSSAKLVVADSVNRPKLDELAKPPSIAVLGGGRGGDFDLEAELKRASPVFEPVMRSGADGFLMMSTSGTTGAPKGVLVPLEALLTFRVYMTDAVDLRPEDSYWNIADPGWAYGLYYAVTGPLLLGHATTFYDGPFTVESAYRMIADYRITNLAGAPTAFRLLMAVGEKPAKAVKGQLRVVSSAGEPLNPEVIHWFEAALDAPIRDHYGQTELGMVVNNHHRLKHPVHPGSAGVPMPGHRVVVLDQEGRELEPGQPGELSIDMTRSPLHWFRGYHQQPTPAISGGYYRTGDNVLMEADRRFTFIGRNDDVITSAGYRIGPFEVESALIEHPAVGEAAVVGKPDPERTEIVKAFVVLRDGYAESAALAEDLRRHVRARLSAHAYPREIAFVPALPKTASGKIQRFILRDQARREGDVQPSRGAA
jgi:acetyl-CoA synthetase